VFLIDTGMLSSYYPGGRASALEICGDKKFTAKYMDQQVVLIDPALSSAKASPGNSAVSVDAPKIADTPLAVAGSVCPATAPPPQ
jgi:hypothetical protein